ncbi:YihY/virulence factor BrkB family protein [Roseivirga sp. BDSF3-8]|uniref:YihY/virulence factor BrkB family protein n=1 Tax=Roseivirga sp. BDSF3-8 TaxID=3241598 RepID=UPI00353233C3
MSNINVETARGHDASKPRHLPGKGWKDIGKRVLDQLKKDHVQITAAGVAFYFFLAIFPTIAAAVSIYGLVMEPAEVEQQISQATAALPPQASDMLSGILEKTASKPGSTLGWSLVLSILLSLWSANKGTSALFEGVNIAYDELDERNFLKKYGITLLFTLGGILIGFICLSLVAGFPALVDSINLPVVAENLINWLRWPLLLVILIFSLSLLYKIAPDRDNAELRWVSWGAVLAAFLWIGASLLFSLYVSNFGSYDQTYGSFAAVIILMMWFFITAFVILLGAEVNSEMEHQTRYDTTVGMDEPMGARGAYHADHVAGKDIES